MTFGPACLPCPTKEKLTKLKPSICCCPDESVYKRDATRDEGGG